MIIKPNWPLALIQQVLAAIKMIVSASMHLQPFTLSLSKRRARLLPFYKAQDRQDQPERVVQVPTCQLHGLNHIRSAA